MVGLKISCSLPLLPANLHQTLVNSPFTTCPTQALIALTSVCDRLGEFPEFPESIKDDFNGYPQFSISLHRPLPLPDSKSPFRQNQRNALCKPRFMN
jgi:hypothetical protein